MLRRPFIHVSSHQLNACVFEGLAGLIVHCDPSNDVDLRVLLVADDVVVGFPTHATRDVGEFGVALPGRRSSHAPEQRWFQNRVRAKRSKNRAAGQSEGKLAVASINGCVAAWEYCWAAYCEPYWFISP